MFENEVEGFLAPVGVMDHLLNIFWQQFTEFLKTALLVELEGVWKEMRQYRLWIFHAVIISLFLAGCGYKADPYYEKREVRR